MGLVVSIVHYTVIVSCVVMVSQVVWSIVAVYRKERAVQRDESDDDGDSDDDAASSSVLSN